MQQLFSQLGIDWHLLLSQTINFFLLLTVLRLFVYKPLLAILHERKQKIEEGITKAEEADRRLLEAEEMKKGKLKEAEAAAVAMLKKTEDASKVLEAKMLAETKQKEAEALRNTEALIKSKEEESRRATSAEAAALVKRAIARTVELAPEAIDEALIARAVKESSR
jgi:F-type H+-transporting ATPase subunit b